MDGQPSPTKCITVMAVLSELYEYAMPPSRNNREIEHMLMHKLLKWRLDGCGYNSMHRFSCGS